MRLIFILILALALLLFNLALNNKSFSTLLLLAEGVFFIALTVGITLYGITGLDYYIKTVTVTLFLFSFEIAIIIIIIYFLNK